MGCSGRNCPIQLAHASTINVTKHFWTTFRTSVLFDANSLLRWWLPPSKLGDFQGLNQHCRQPSLQTQVTQWVYTIFNVYRLRGFLWNHLESFAAIDATIDALLLVGTHGERKKTSLRLRLQSPSMTSPMSLTRAMSRRRVSHPRAPPVCCWAKKWFLIIFDVLFCLFLLGGLGWLGDTRYWFIWCLLLVYNWRVALAVWHWTKMQ